MQRIFRYAINAVAALLLAMGMTSCGDLSVFEDEGDCDPHYYLKFVFDRNMLYNDQYQIGADAFAAQVGSVDVYIFDAKTGDFVARYSDAGERLREFGYRLPIDIKPGDYEIIAWCGLADNDGHFTIADNISSYSDLKCRMARSMDGNQVTYSDKCLNALFHGRITHTFPDKEGDHYATVNLTKDTNYIQLALHHNAGELDPDRFSVMMEDDNGYLAYDNSLIDDITIQYRPWSIRGGVVDMETDGYNSRAAEDGTGFLVAELATSRLTANHNPLLTVTDNVTGRVVFSLPLVKYVLMMKSDRYSKMEAQEYLDREDEYSVIVFLQNNKKDPDNNDPDPEPNPDPDDDEGWYAVEIVINGWHIVDNGNVGLH